MHIHTHSLSLATVLLLAPGVAPAQGVIYRCGDNQYTNTVSEAQKPHCKVVEGGNLTIVQGLKAPGAPAAGNTAVKVATSAPAPAPAGGGGGAARVDSAEQRARDADARRILESELRKAESRKAELEQEYKNGEPDKRGDEARNYQKYLDRVAELKAGIARSDSDIAGIQREIARLPVVKQQ